jgi:hypothetical protein
MDWEDVKVPSVFNLPEGGRMEITDDALVPMGDAYAHRQVTYRTDTCEIVFEVHNGVPGCASVKLWSKDETPIRAKDLDAIKLDQLRDRAFAVTGVLMPDPDGGHELTHQAVRKAIDSATSRRKITAQLLRRIAQVYGGTPAGQRTEAVRAAFGVSERQALRYIKLARQKELIK